MNFARAPRCKAGTHEPSGLGGKRRAQAALPGKRRGFTLLEVLVALAIFAMASIVLAGAYINILNGYDIASRANAYDADVAFARSIVLNEPDREKLEQGGEFDGAEGRHVRWTVEITSTNTADLFNVLFTCEMTGSGPQSGEPEKVVQTFTVLRPTWSTDQAEHDKLREDAKTRILELQGQIDQQQGRSPSQRTGSPSPSQPSTPRPTQSKGRRM